VALRITARNFGPIAFCDVTLSPFTVFIGANNTGKSFMCALIYASQATSRRHRRSYFGERVDVVGHGKLTEDLRVAHAGIAEMLTEMLKKLGPDRQARKSLISNGPQALRNLLREIVRINLEEYAIGVHTELERCLGGYLHEFARGGKPGRMLRISISDPTLGWSITISGGVDSDGRVLARRDASRIPSGRALAAILDPILEGTLNDAFQAQSFLSQYAEEFSAVVTGRILAEFAASLFVNVPSGRHYLPAARSGIIQSHKALAAFLIRSAPLVGLQRMEVPQLSGILADFISQLVSMDYSRRRVHGRPYAVATELEREVLKGTIGLRTERNAYPEIFYRAGGVEVPLVRLSSMISELAPVVLYLRYVLRRGHHLIIEEPEAHLHPANQRAFAKALSKLQRESRVSILLTTHSDYLLTQINNMIRMGTLIQQREAVNDTDGPDETADSILAIEDVSAYLFTAGETSGTKVRRLEISEIDGIPDGEFSAVAEAVYEEAVHLQYQLFEEEGGHESQNP
jgi:predicted ATPase